MTAKLTFATTPDNGFAAWIQRTSIAAYAYPTSTHADDAKRSPKHAQAAAYRMIAEEMAALPGFVMVCGFDRYQERAEHLIQMLAAAPVINVTEFDPETMRRLSR